MATTIEEILVKFTGDASGLSNASDKAKAKTRSLEEEILKLDRILKNAKPNTSTYDAQFEKLRTSAIKYGNLLEKIQKSEAKLGNVGSPMLGGGYGGGGGGRLGIKGAFAAGAGVAAITHTYHYVAEVLRPVFEKGFKDFFGLTETFRRHQEEIVRSETLDHDRTRVASNRSLAEGRAIGQMIDPNTGEVQIDRQAQAWRERQARTQKELEAANRRVESVRKDLRDKDTFGRHLPGVGAGQQMEYEDAQREEKSALAEVERLKGQRDMEMNRALDLEAGGTAMERMAKRIQIEAERSRRQSNLVGLKPGAAKREELMQQLDDIRDQTPAMLIADIDKMVAKIDEQVKALEELDKKKEQFAAKELVRVHKATRGFDGFEADVLARNSDGRQVGNQERLQVGYEKEADAINKRFLPATVKAQIEIDRLNLLREKGLLTQEAYDKAILEQAKMMDAGGRAGSRAATLSGSAEQASRVFEYSRLMQQPQADAANVDRAAKENRDNPVVKAIREQSTILRQIEKGLGVEGKALKVINAE